MIAIIRIQPGALEHMETDLERLTNEGFRGLRFHIPKVRVLKRSVHNQDLFEHKPLLFNYGFMEIPIQYLRNPVTLNEIRQISEVISGWFYRKPGELEEEKLQQEADGLTEFIPILVKTIVKDQLDILYEEAGKLDVYDGSDHLQIGSYVVLEKYPFSGLSAKVLRKKTNGKVQVELLDSKLHIWLDVGSILYTPYTEQDSYQF